MRIVIDLTIHVNWSNDRMRITTKIWITSRFNSWDCCKTQLNTLSLSNLANASLAKSIFCQKISSLQLLMDFEIIYEKLKFWNVWIIFWKLGNRRISSKWLRKHWRKLRTITLRTRKRIVLFHRRRGKTRRFTEAGKRMTSLFCLALLYRDT